MFMIFAGSRILFINSLRSINGEYVLLSIIIKNEREIIAPTPKPITIGTVAESDALIVCMNCNATRNEITVIDSVIAPVISTLDLFLLNSLLEYPGLRRCLITIWRSYLT